MTAPQAEVILSVGELTVEWCPQCARLTLGATSIYVVSPSGASRIGEYAICGECGWSPYATGTGRGQVP
jgi:hypothetical protein